MVLDPIPQSLPVHFLGLDPSPPPLVKRDSRVLRECRVCCGSLECVARVSFVLLVLREYGVCCELYKRVSCLRDALECVARVRESLEGVARVSLLQHTRVSHSAPSHKCTQNSALC